MYKMVSEMFRPTFPTSPFKRLVCMEMNINVPNFPTYRGSPFIKTPFIEVPQYIMNNNSLNSVCIRLQATYIDYSQSIHYVHGIGR